MLHKAWFVLAVCCITSSLLFSQTTTNQNRRESYAIQGKVIIPNGGASIERIEVKLERAAGQTALVTFTDAAGNFDFRSLTVGTYAVVVDLEGYEPVRQSVEVINSFGANSITIFLSKPAAVIKNRSTGLDADDPDVIDVSQMKENLPKKAVQDYERAIEEKQKGRLESAIKLLEEAIHIAPNFFHAHNNLGTLYLSSKRYAAAETEFKRSHELSPKAERPLTNLGRLYLEEATLKKDDEAGTGKILDEALDALEEAAKLNPRSATAYFLLGQANYRSSFFEEAEAAFKKVQVIDPNLTSARLMLANVYMKQRRWNDVLETLDAYLKDNPKAADRTSVEALRARIAKDQDASVK
jgi:tetratricopeptide (TPR) repeat protein